MIYIIELESNLFWIIGQIATEFDDGELDFEGKVGAGEGKLKGFTMNG